MNRRAFVAAALAAPLMPIAADASGTSHVMKEELVPPTTTFHIGEHVYEFTPVSARSEKTEHRYIFARRNRQQDFSSEYIAVIYDETALNLFEDQHHYAHHVNATINFLIRDHEQDFAHAEDGRIDRIPAHWWIGRVLMPQRVIRAK